MVQVPSRALAGAVEAAAGDGAVDWATAAPGAPAMATIATRSPRAVKPRPRLRTLGRWL